VAKKVEGVAFYDTTDAATADGAGLRGAPGVAVISNHAGRWVDGCMDGWVVGVGVEGMVRGWAAGCNERTQQQPTEATLNQPPIT